MKLQVLKFQWATGMAKAEEGMADAARAEGVGEMNG